MRERSPVTGLMPLYPPEATPHDATTSCTPSPAASPPRHSASSRSGHSHLKAKGRGTNAGDRTKTERSRPAVTTKPGATGAPEATEPPDHIDLGADSALGRYVPDTFADDAAAGINAARARYFACRRDSSSCRARCGHDNGTRDGAADDRLLLDASRSVHRGRPNTDRVDRPRELGYQKPALPFAFTIIILVVSFVVFFFLAADHFKPKQHNGRGRQSTSTASQNR
jgi:hypothetical protein